MKSFIYIFRKFRTASILNLIGLTVAFAAFFIFMTQVEYGYNYNKSLKDYERLYRLEGVVDMLGDAWTSNMSRPQAEFLATQPQVEGVALYTGRGTTLIDANGSQIKCDMSIMLPKTFVTLGTEVVDGTLELHKGDERVVIPRSIAEKLFGESMVAGRNIKFANNGEEHVIAGVYEDFPSNCLMPNNLYVDMGDENENAANNYNYDILIKLNENVDGAQYSEDITPLLQQLMVDINISMGGEITEEEKAFLEDYMKGYKFRLVPLTETYFSGVNPFQDKGNKGIQLVLELACILVLIVAAINFTNFTLAEAPMRIKGINTRKVLGQSVASLRLGIIAECVLTALISAALATLLIYIVSELPTIGNITLGSVRIGDHIGLLFLTIAIALLIGVVAGVYPAYFATSLPTALALKGSFGLTPGGKQLRKVLVTVQLVASMIMVTYIGILFLQSHYLYNSDNGYDQESLLTCTMFNDKNRETVRTELMKVTGVEDVAFSQFFLGATDQMQVWGRRQDDKQVTITVVPADWHIINTLGIKILEGRSFNEHDADCYIVNQKTKDLYDWIDIDKPLLEGEMPVVGICNNLRFYSARRPVDDMACAFLIYGPKHEGWGWFGQTYIRVGKNVDKHDVLKKCEKIVRASEGNESSEVHFLDYLTETTYKEEFRFITQVQIFSLICVLITLIGVFCLTMFETEYRRKEIGIRKVMGSSTSEIVTLLSRSYFWIVLLSFVIAAPVAYRMGEEWLQNFAQHTPIYWWLFPISLVVVASIVMATVGIQSYRAAIANPVNSIKTE